jgi:hypothetical protein
LLLALLLIVAPPIAGQQHVPPQFPRGIDGAAAGFTSIGGATALPPRPISSGAGRQLGSGAGIRPSTSPTRLLPVIDGHSLTARLRLAPLPGPQPARNALLGGLIGAATGLATCTVISNLVKDSGTGFSTCTAGGYVAFGLSGLAVGALVGTLVK